MSIKAMKQALEALLNHTEDCRVHIPMDGTCTCGAQQIVNELTAALEAAKNVDLETKMANCEFCKMQDNCPGLNDCVHREDNTEPVAWRHKEYHYMTSATKWSDDCVPLYTAPQPAIPAGYALVPVEPTEGMIDKVIDERYNALLTGKDHTLIDVYKAMLAAAPKPVAHAWQPTNEELTTIYMKANGIEGKNPPITTERIFTAMRAMLAAAPKPENSHD